MALIAATEAAGIRTALSVFFVHRCTVTPVSAGSADAWGQDTETDGTPVTAVPCKYRAEDRVVIEETGQTLVSVPTVTVAHDLAVSAGDKVSNVQDAAGVVLFAGPARVEFIVHSAGLGYSMKKRLVLRGADVR